MMKSQLPPALRAQVIQHLQFTPGQPDLAALRRLIDAYVRTVPWESVSRISRRARAANLDSCPRWPDQFWQEALEQGMGGTCFESNYAFFALLRDLGYDGYLTVNNMGDTAGCHTAVVLELDGEQWLVDMGLPLYAPLQIQPHRATHAATPLMTYTAVPEDPLHIQIERAPHPQRNAFTLVNRPVADADYRAATKADYGPGGHFLDRVIVNKIVDEVPWRFSSADTPPMLNYFRDGRRFDELIAGDVAAAVAAKFTLDEQIVRHALAVTPQRPSD
jgi:arylamine N-acetyltransferase